MKNDESYITQYAERDIEALDEQGKHYCRHVFSMTHEGLHSKSDIAAELAYRDHKIETLESDYATLSDQHQDLMEECTKLRQEVEKLKTPTHFYIDGQEQAHEDLEEMARDFSDNRPAYERSWVVEVNSLRSLPSRTLNIELDKDGNIKLLWMEKCHAKRI